jgi:hypothetical protein
MYDFYRYSDAGGNVNIKLGVPKDTYMSRISTDWFESNGITVAPNDAKEFSTGGHTFFLSDDGEYALVYMKDMDNIAALTYVDKDVKITGTYTNDGYTQKMNCSLKTGWNYVFALWDGTTNTQTFTTTEPSGFRWQVIDADDLP